MVLRRKLKARKKQNKNNKTNSDKRPKGVYRNDFGFPTIK